MTQVEIDHHAHPVTDNQGLEEDLHHLEDHHQGKVVGTHHQGVVEDHHQGQEVEDHQDGLVDGLEDHQETLHHHQGPEVEDHSNQGKVGEMMRILWPG